MTSNELLRHLPDLREMDPFKEFVDEARAEGSAEALRAAILGQGRKKFGPPSAAHEQAVNAATEPARLEARLDKVSDVRTWDELLAE